MWIPVTELGINWRLCCVNTFFSFSFISNIPWNKTYLSAYPHSIGRSPYLQIWASERCVPYTYRERKRERMGMSLWHIPSLSQKWDIVQESDPQTPTNPFQADQIGSSNNRLYSSTFCTSKGRRGGIQKGETDREREREEYTCSTDLHCQDSVNVLCVGTTGTGRLGPHDLITRLTKSPRLSPQEIWEVGYLGREESGSHKTSEVDYTCAGPHPSKDLCPETAARG